MKLPNFHDDPKFNTLRAKMNAPLVIIKNWEFNWDDIDLENIRQKLNSLEGIEIEDFDKEIEICDDFTLEYKGQKILVYIQDQYYRGEGNSLTYKYHIAECKTLKDFKRQNRFDKRYRISTRTDGKFLVNVIDVKNNICIEENVLKELYICKNCLKKLNYKNYNYLSQQQKRKIYETFSLKEFFEQYSTQHNTLPNLFDRDEFVNQYTKDFSKISKKIKMMRNYTCEKCGIRVEENDIRFLHIHHRNGIKTDNHSNNLECLCIKCHSEYPGHSKLRKQRDYFDFYNKYLSEF